jgi:glucokinase
MSVSVTAGVDLGGTNLKVGLVAAGGSLVVQHSTPTDLSAGPAGLVARIGAAVRSLLDRVRADASPPRRLDDVRLVAAGIGSPGPLSPSRGIIYRCANLPGLEGAPLRQLLADELGVPAAIENDANVAAYGEAWTGAGRGVRDLVLLTLGTGIGCGAVLDGAILHGHFENATELGHMIVQRDGEPCPCGQRGCLERYASATAIARRVGEAIRAGERSVLADGGSRRAADVDAADVARGAQCGDALCLRIWREACDHLAIACVNIQHAYNPALVLLGGGMADAGSFLLDEVRSAFARQKWSLADDFPTIELATLGNNAGVIGAGRLAWDTRGG